ncbi:IclR family transcriptional regulator [Sphingomonas sp. GB1N7]|uniref:IclR family transcriptional regulator n=1 Tax=Parasphingomonas caseinilytica TaxID=3096158 RepID=UPI002FC85317
MAKTEEIGPDRNGVQVIARAASVLRALENQPQGLSLGDLASQLGLARSTVQRIVKALADEQLLMPASSKSRVKLGPLLVRLGQSAEVDILQFVKPVMEELAAQIGETVDLSLFKDRTALFIDQVVGTQRLAAVSHSGTEFPLHSTANGKALLASLAPSAAALLLSEPLDRDTENTITSIATLNAELMIVRNTKVAFDREEHTLGVSAVGTWFEDPAGRPYAISVPVPSMRFADGAALIGPLLKARARILRHIASTVPHDGFS